MFYNSQSTGNGPCFRSPAESPFRASVGLFLLRGRGMIVDRPESERSERGATRRLKSSGASRVSVGNSNLSEKRGGSLTTEQCATCSALEPDRQQPADAHPFVRVGVRHQRCDLLLLRRQVVQSQNEQSSSGSSRPRDLIPNPSLTENNLDPRVGAIDVRWRV